MAKKKSSKTKEKLKGRNGITLIALVITIIVLLILAGVTIASITGENGILSKAIDAKENTTRGTEEEQIKNAYLAVKINTLGDSINIAQLEEELDNIVGEGKTQVSNPGKIKVKFLDTGNEYVVK